MGTDLDSIIGSPQPMAQIFLNSFGKKGALAVWAVIVVVQYMMGSSMVCPFVIWGFRKARMIDVCDLITRFLLHLANHLPSPVMEPCRFPCGFTA